MNPLTSLARSLPSLAVLTVTALPAGAQCDGGSPVPAPPPFPPVADGPTRPEPARTGGPAASTPQPSGAAPQPATPVPSRPTPTQPGGILSIPRTIELGQLDRTEWWDWWDYNKERFLGLDEALARLHPVTPRADRLPSDDLGRRAGLSAARVYGELVPALVAELEAEKDPFFQRRALLALGRIGEAPRGTFAGAVPLFDVLSARLREGNLGVAEAAVVSLGALGSSDAVQLLAELVSDTERARDAVARGRVPVRMRALAAYGLGISGSSDVPVVVRRFAVHSLASVLSADVAHYPDVQAAAVIALGLSPVPGGGDGSAEDAPPSAGLAAQVRFVLDLLEDEDQPRMVRTHAPTAVARLLASGEVPDELREIAFERLFSALDRREDVAVRRSAVLGLGALADADEDPHDVEARSRLTAMLEKGDLPSRSFAAISLAQIASRAGTGAGEPYAAVEPVARTLSRQLVRGKSFERPWAALALGVMGFHLREAGETLPQNAADALRGELRREHNPIESSAMALAIGMVGDARGLEDIAERLADEKADDFVGHFAVGLGLLRQRAAIEPLAELMADAEHRPERMENAALGRALIGDRTLLDELVDRLDDCDCAVSTRGVGRALAWAADERGIAPLLAIARDSEKPALTRANAVEALGRIADRSNVAWDVRISRGLNYLDAPTSLTDPTGYGILDTF